MNKLFSLDSYADKNATFRNGTEDGFFETVQMGNDLTEAYIKNNYANTLTAYGYNSDKENKYDILNKAYQTALFRYVFQDEKFEMTPSNLAIFKKKNPLKMAQRERYYDVVNAVETTVTPAVTTMFTGKYAEVKITAIGDTPEFNVKSNEILLVNRSAKGVSFGGEQHLFNDTKTIQTSALNISFDTNWYQVAAGKADFGEMFFKAGQGFANYFTVQAYNKLLEMAQQVPASYRFTGFTTENIDLCTEAVAGANQNVLVSILGTLPSLRDVVPTNDFFKLGIGEEWVKMGYVGSHGGSPLVKLSNLLNPATINSNATAGVPQFMFKNNILFVLPFVGRKPIKIVFEGGMFNASLSAIETADQTERASLTYLAGVDFVYDQIMGLVTRS